MMRPYVSRAIGGTYPDGITPGFEEGGAVPTVATVRPPGSIIRVGTVYYWQMGTLAAPVWAVVGGAVGGRVTLSGTATKMSVPVADGEGHGRIHIAGRLVGDGATPRAVTIRINDSAVNVDMDYLLNYNAVSSVATGLLAQVTDQGLFVDIQMDTAHGSAGLRRMGLFSGSEIRVGNPVLLGWHSVFRFNDTTTAITSIDVYVDTANTLVAGSYLVYEEIQLP
jgi:hypothetical protein